MHIETLEIGSVDVGDGSTDTYHKLVTDVPVDERNMDMMDMLYDRFCYNATRAGLPKASSSCTTNSTSSLQLIACARRAQRVSGYNGISQQHVT